MCFSAFPSRNFVHSDIDLFVVGHRSCEIQGNFNVNHTDSVCDDCHRSRSRRSSRSGVPQFTGWPDHVHWVDRVGIFRFDCISSSACVLASKWTVGLILCSRSVPCLLALRACLLPASVEGLR